MNPAANGVYGLMAEFTDPDHLVKATQAAYDEGYRMMDAYSPFPIEELPHALGLKKSKVSLTVLIGGILGGLGGYLLQWYCEVYSYPLNVGGRPLHSWPAFIVITFEMTILFAAFAAVFGMLTMNGLPKPYHPVFNAPRFELATRDRFFLCIEADDPKFDLQGTATFLRHLNPREVNEVAL